MSILDRLSFKVVRKKLRLKITLASFWYTFTIEKYDLLLQRVSSYGFSRGDDALVVLLVRVLLILCSGSN